ncbi:hypothetical protein CEXT_296091 [Caerostris extrusa]|uniref:Uncharacterized protein n=1 Tax=Caerostris extrusa TaxID=172846 RepID=A0AAV4SCK2_CAEEX|nr:hypothetical protein CEXT_296091 [Caerostris extrusa]
MLWRRSLIYFRCYRKFNFYSTINTNGIKSTRHKNVSDTFVKRLCSAIGQENVSISLPVREQCGTDEVIMELLPVTWLFFLNPGIKFVRLQNFAVSLLFLSFHGVQVQV